MNTNPRYGLASTRFLKALAAAKGDIMEAIAYASSQNWGSTPAVLPALKAAVSPLSTDNAAALLGAVGFDFSEFLRPATIIGRLIGLRRVPFQTRMLAQDAGTAAGWTGQAKPMPVTRADFSGETLGLLKVAAIAIVTQELALSSAPSAESALSRDLGRAGVQALDAAFIDPDNAGVSGEQPASVTNGAPSFPSSGDTLANIDADAGLLLNSLSDEGSDLSMAVWCMRPRSTIYLARLRDAGGALAYPTVTAKGGIWMGLPVITSANVPIVSPASGDPTSIVLLDPTQITLADDGDAEFMVSNQATVEMSDAPGTGAVAQAVSLWQMHLIGIRMVRAMNWHARAAGAAAVLTGVTY